MSTHDRANSAAYTALRNSPWFRGLEDELLRAVAGLSVTRTYGEGEVLFVRDEPGDYLYGVISGRVRISTQSAEGRELALNTLGPGDIGGEIAVLDGGPRTATGTALTKTTVFVVPRDSFTRLLLNRPSIALHLIRLLCERIRLSSQQIEDAAFLPLPQRIALHLNGLVQEQGAPLPCRVKVSQTEVALFLNVTRQVVNRSLQTMQAAGQVELSRGSILVKDLSGVLPEVP